MALASVPSCLALSTELLPPSLPTSPSTLTMDVPPLPPGAFRAANPSESLVRPVALRCDTRVDRDDPRGAHCVGGLHCVDEPLPRKVARPRRHLRSRSYGDADLRFGRPQYSEDGPRSCAPEVLRPASPGSRTSFGSAVTGEGERQVSASSTEWSDLDEAGARAVHYSAVIAATGGSWSPAASDLSDCGRRRAWVKRGGRTLSLSLQPASDGMSPSQCFSHPNLQQISRCRCGYYGYASDSARWRREARSLPRSCTCNKECASHSASGVPKGVHAFSKRQSPDKRLFRFLKRRLSWSNKLRR